MNYLLIILHIVILKCSQIDSLFNETSQFIQDKQGQKALDSLENYIHEISLETSIDK